MLNITPFSTTCIEIDSYADYVPLVSSVTNLFNLFLKYVYRPCVDETQLQNNHYFAYLDTKTFLRCLTLIILPVLGNVLIAILDIYYAIEAEEMEQSASLVSNLTGPRNAQDAFLGYFEAASYGSVEAQYQIGHRLFYGIGIQITDSIKAKAHAKQAFRDAAALGHVKAQQALNELFS